MGAGVAGLVAARCLVDAGCRVTLFECEARVGGRVRSVRLGEAEVDAGASHVWSFYHRTRAWLRRLGLDSELIPVPELGPGLGLGWAELPGVARCALDVARWWPRLDPTRPRRAAPLDDRSIAAYAGPRLGAALQERLLRPAFEWNAFCDLDEMSRVLLLQSGRLFLGARASRLGGGLERLPRALASGLGLVFGPEGEVGSLEETASGVVVERRQGEARLFAAAVVAAPPGVAAGLLPTLPSPTRRFLRSVRHSVLRRAWWELEPLPGDPGWLLRHERGEPRLVLAGRGGRALMLSLAAYGPGLGRPGPDRGAAELRSWAARLWPALEKRPVRASAAFDWERAVTIFSPGHFRALARLGPAPGGARVALAGDYLVSPTVEGAVISGEVAARRLLPILGR